MHSEFIETTCLKLHSSNIINKNECVLYTVLLAKYFQDNNITVKPHVSIIYNHKINNSILHMWLTYKDKKIDVTSHEQGIYSITSYILGKKLIEIESSDNMLANLYGQEKNIETLTLNNFQREIFFNAALNEDISFDINLLNKLIDNPSLYDNKIPEDFQDKYNEMIELEIFTV